MELDEVQIDLSWWISWYDNLNELGSDEKPSRETIEDDAKLDAHITHIIRKRAKK